MLYIYIDKGVEIHKSPLFFYGTQRYRVIEFLSKPQIYRVLFFQNLFLSTLVIVYLKNKMYICSLKIIR